MNLAYRSNAGDSKYESLQVHLQKRFSKGLTFDVAYAYASYLSDAGNINGGGKLRLTKLQLRGLQLWSDA